MILNDLFESRMSDLDIEYQDYKNMEPVAFYSRYKMTPAEWLAKHWSLTKGSQTVHEGAVKDLHTELAEKYQELAPKIEKYKDSFLAGQLYDALEAIAIEHDAELEFKRMMTGARNRAHMDYDTNPGGFQNWFWYLPFADEQLDEIDRRGFLKGLGATAGLAAMGGAKAQTDPWDPSWNKVGQKYDSSITSNTVVKQTANKQPEVFDRIADVKGPNNKGEYLVTVIHNNDIVSHYVTKKPPQSWMQGKHKAYPQVSEAQSIAEESQDDRNARIIAGEIEDAMSQGNQSLAQQKIKELTKLGYYFDKQGRLQRMGMYEESTTPIDYKKFSLARSAAPEEKHTVFNLFYNKQFVGDIGYVIDSWYVGEPQGRSYGPLQGKYKDTNRYATKDQALKALIKAVEPHLNLVAEEKLDEKQDACYHKVKSRYKVWPSAYASGALVQCRKKGAANWGNKTKK